LTEGIIAPGDIAGAGEGGAGLGDVAALAEGVHEVIILLYGGGASFVFLHVEDVAVWLVGVIWGKVSHFNIFNNFPLSMLKCDT
jgi:hypothetical protein